MSANPFRSATFRLSLAAVPLYVAAGWALLAFVYFNTLAIMEKRVDTGLIAERHRLLEDLVDLDRASLIEALQSRVQAERGSARLYLLTARDGEALAANFAKPATPVPSAGQFTNQAIRREPNGQTTRARLAAVTLSHGLTLVLGRDLAEEDQFRRVIEETLGIAVILTVVLALIAGTLSSRAVLRRLGGLNATARRMLHGQIEERMPVTGGGDEFDDLAHNLNEALDRIVELMEASRQVTDNIAHDLRGPLARVRNRLELSLISANPADGVEDVLAASVADIDIVLETFESLLSIARLEHGLSPHFQPVDLAALAEDLADYFLPLAEEKGVSLGLDALESVWVAADPHLMFQALSNIVDNAIRHTPEGGHIRVEARRRDGMAVVSVADDGPGIPKDQRQEVLKRFVRLDASRHQPGNGLGLAVVEAVARHHHARLELDDNQPGLRVSLTLPALPDTARA